jgi:hypothetical protein
MKTAIEIIVLVAIVSCGFYLHGQAQAPVADPNPIMARLAVRELPPLETSQPFLIPASFSFHELQGEVRGREAPAAIRKQGRSEREILRDLYREKDEAPFWRD